jgi:transketolase
MAHGAAPGLDARVGAQAAQHEVTQLRRQGEEIVAEEIREVRVGGGGQPVQERLGGVQTETGALGQGRAEAIGL